MMTDEQAAGEIDAGGSVTVSRGYVCPARDQLFLLPVCMRDWVEEGHLAWFVLDVVAQMDTSGVHSRTAGCPGRPPYQPEMMCALVLYAYCCAIRSSRRIEAACRTDAAFRVICGGLVPDHATIARFVAEHERALAGLFVEGLRLCAAAGLADLEVLALDGTKIAADASLARNRDAGWIRREVAKLIAVTSEADDLPPAPATDTFGGLEPVAEICSPAGRLARLQAALEVVEAQDAIVAADAQRAALAAVAEAEHGRKLAGRKPTEPHAGLARAQIDHQVAQTRVNTMQAARGEARRRDARADDHRAATLPDQAGQKRPATSRSGAHRRPRGSPSHPRDNRPGEPHRSRQPDHEHPGRLGAGLQRPSDRQPAPDRARLRRQPGHQ